MKIKKLIKADVVFSSLIFPILISILIGMLGLFKNFIIFRYYEASLAFYNIDDTSLVNDNLTMFNLILLIRILITLIPLVYMFYFTYTRFEKTRKITLKKDLIDVFKLSIIMSFIFITLMDINLLLKNLAYVIYFIISSFVLTALCIIVEGFVVFIERIIESYNSRNKNIDYSNKSFSVLNSLLLVITEFLLILGGLWLTLPHLAKEEARTKYKYDIINIQNENGTEENKIIVYSSKNSYIVQNFKIEQKKLIIDTSSYEIIDKKDKVIITRTFESVSKK